VQPNPIVYSGIVLILKYIILMEVFPDYKSISLPVFFLDETGILNKKDDQFFALGTVKTERPHELQRMMRAIRDKAHYYEEIKWTKISPLKFDVCKAIVDAFIKNRPAIFSCIILKKSDLDFEKYFQSDLTKVYKSFSVRLLKNNINSEANEICTVIADDYFYPDGTNLELASRAIINDHYKRLVVSCFLQINSKSSDLLQLTDLLLGAVVYDLKLQEGLVKKHENLKFKFLEYLHSQLSVNNSFFLNKKGFRQDRFLTDKLKVSIFKPSAGESPVLLPQN
jgi:hypothetical protein